ncbi:HNH endonuclease signature motif containing protein [Stenotrophomonas maltophilia]|uniref:HNH endonuclease signature motif containing protein n=1 Tax=Stenotrophomonas maltophilia TaxID=40324 RepID=UPI0013DB64C4|nr:HNH endonuclease signature motif containing protein [Stenotrophomonas maltophilia]
MKTLQLSRGLVCVLDDEDFAIHGHKKWSASKHRGRHSYAYRTEAGKRVYLHRLIAAPARGLCVDHIDGDTLNNRRSNLRCVTNAQNSRNQHVRPRSATGEACVHLHTKGFVVRIPRAGGGRVYGGVFSTIAKAVARRDQLIQLESGMNRVEYMQHLDECIRVIESSPPMTREEIVAHLSRCAAEQARAEARRTATPQPDLLGAA